MKMQTSVQSIFVSIFCLGLLRLSTGTYEAISSTAADVVNHLERFWPTSFQFGNVQKAFLLSLRGKIIANILRFLGRREWKMVRNNSKKLPKLFHYGFTEKIFKQKRPECPFNLTSAFTWLYLRYHNYISIRLCEKKKKTITQLSGDQRSLLDLQCFKV